MSRHAAAEVVKLFQELGNLSGGNNNGNGGTHSISTHRLSSPEPCTLPVTGDALLVENAQSFTSV